MSDRWQQIMDESDDLTHSRYLLSAEFSDRQECYEKRIIVGSTSRRLPRRREGRWTHQFRVYVAAESDEELADYVQKVVFRFTDNCATRAAIVEQPPYQASSYCRADSCVTVTVLFREANHTCIIFNHTVQLHSADAEANRQPCTLNETVHTITFVNPSTRMLKNLHLERRASSKYFIGRPPPAGTAAGNEKLLALSRMPRTRLSMRLQGKLTAHRSRHSKWVTETDSST